jgi:uncharacterized membrane protein YedE/YeeE
MDLRAVLEPLLGGALIGLASGGLLLFNGRIAGISGIVAGLVGPERGDVAWRAAFVAGLLVVGAVLASSRPELFDVAVARSPARFVLAGALVGVGTRLGHGCTSGHGVCGVGRGSLRSLAATGAFMVSGAAVVFLTHHVVGGPS